MKRLFFSALAALVAMGAIAPAVLAFDSPLGDGQTLQAARLNDLHAGHGN